MSEKQRTNNKRGPALASSTKLLYVILMSLLLISCSDVSEKKSATQPGTAEKTRVAPKKILYVDSYHQDYLPNSLARKAFVDGINKLETEIRYEFMDAKHKKTAELQQSEALRINEIVKQWQPDLIVAADDSANKYLIAPYHTNTTIPVVFNGVNWDASAYGYPATNVTGQIEVELMLELIANLQPFSRGRRIGLLTGDTLTDRKSLKYYTEILKLKFDQIAFVDTFAEWKEQFLQQQKQVDILILRNNAGISGWDNELARQFSKENISVPTGCISSHLNQYSLVCLPKKNEEFGEISARMSIEILSEGKAPTTIPIVTNEKSKIYLNMQLAKKLGVKFPIELIEQATFVE